MSAAAAVEVRPSNAERVQQTLLAWYAAYARDLPWRRTRDPYAILVSEVMLQQTQVSRVIPKWHAWLKQFPTLTALAAASRADVIRAWQGLGYNLRAVRLHRVAEQAVREFDGRLPSELESLLVLDGIGRYTAGAVACFAFERPVAMVDTNVRRVLGRVFLGIPTVPREHERRVQHLADAMVPPTAAYAWNQALMDLGATVCSAERPVCLVCPLLHECRAAPLMGAWPVEKRRLAEKRAPYIDAEREAAVGRQQRGRAVNVVRGLSADEMLPLSELGRRVREDFDPHDPAHAAWVTQLARKLAADGLLRLEEFPGGPRVALPV